MFVVLLDFVQTNYGKELSNQSTCELTGITCVSNGEIHSLHQTDIYSTSNIGVEKESTLTLLIKEVVLLNTIDELTN